MVNNFMKLNESKTELLVMGKPRVLEECDLFDLERKTSLQQNVKVISGKVLV